MGYDTGLADRLRAAGVRVVECAGWQSHGSSSFYPGGSVNHHTAGGASGSCPSLNTCINGRPDLPGPLCNVMQSREPDGNDIAYVIAAGRANHAGDGGWQGLSGNSSVYGLEIEHTGTSELPYHRQEIAARIHAAMFGGDVGMVCQHYEWTTRKIDAATNVDGNEFRNLVAHGGGGYRPPDNAQQRLLIGDGMFIMWGPYGAAVAAPDYFKWITQEEVDWLHGIPGPVPEIQCGQRGWDVLRACMLYGATHEDQNQ